MSAEPARTLKVTLLTRSGCHLCDEAAEELRGYLSSRAEDQPSIELELVDIESDDELHRHYLEKIPVIKVGDEVVSEFTFEPDEFEAALQRRQREMGRGRVR